MATRSSGSRYWAVQIGVSAFFAVVCLGAGAFLVFQTDEPGRGVILGCVGLMFVALLVWLVVKMMSSTREQRAIYAWAIMQQEPTNRFGPSGNDVVSLHVAELAREGKLPDKDLLELQALRPENPYPGTLPH